MARFRTFTIFSAGLAYLLFFVLVSLKSQFSHLGVPVMSLPFSDLRLVTSASSCAQLGEWSYLNLSCDPWGRPFNYPSLWVEIFSAVGIVESHTVIIGTLQVVLLIGAFFYWLGFALISEVSNFKKLTLFMVAFIFASSPPILLLMERGNVDSLIFLALSVASILLSRGNFYIPVTILSLIGALKIYPLASLLCLVKSQLGVKRVFFVLLSACLAGISFLGEWQFVLNRSTTSWNSISYGSSLIPLILFQIFGFAGSKSLAAILGWLMFFMTVLFMKYLIAGWVLDLGKMLCARPKLMTVFQIFGLAFLFTYLVGTSYDLRLILLLPIFLCLTILLTYRLQKISLIGIIIVIMYGGQLTSGLGKFGLLLNMTSDLTLMIFTSLLFLLIWGNLFETIKHFNPKRQRLQV